jgi:hypothetical protein
MARAPRTKAQTESQSRANLRAVGNAADDGHEPAIYQLTHWSQAAELDPDDFGTWTALAKRLARDPVACTNCGHGVTRHVVGGDSEQAYTTLGYNAEHQSWDRVPDRGRVWKATCQERGCGCHWLARVGDKIQLPPPTIEEVLKWGDRYTPEDLRRVLPVRLLDADVVAIKRLALMVLMNFEQIQAALAGAKSAQEALGYATGYATWTTVWHMAPHQDPDE